MSRPKYETDKDLANEKTIIPIIERHFKCKIKKLPISYMFDFLFYREGKAWGCGEYKRRKVAYTKYPFIILSAAKFYKATNFGRMLDAGFHFIVEFDDGIFYAPLQIELDYVAKEFDIGWGGREDRGDSQDMEPVIHIPINKFFRIKQHGGNGNE
jgi:hypothetical protein